MSDVAVFQNGSALPRRDLLRFSAFAGAAFVIAPSTANAARSVFRHGVASGDPLPDRVILWTRVTPTSDALPGSGRGPSVTVGYEVAEDAVFKRVVRRGSTTTGPAHDHTVKVDAAGLHAGRTYFYRFTFDGQRSPIGRTKTAPTGSVSQLRFGVVSCSNYQAGHFAAYQHLAERGDLDAVVHLGDYLYEYGPGEYGAFRAHQPAREVTTLAEYRMRHGQYKTDPQLQQLHAAYPWIITWDDHESANDAWSGGAENHTEGAEGTWVARRAAALRAYHEWMPIRFGAGDTIYRKLGFGSLASLSMLDLRSYRAKQGTQGSLTGPGQMAFLRESLLDSDVQWKLVGNPVMFSPLLVPPLPLALGTALASLTGQSPDGVVLNNDQWDGYAADRRALISLLADNGVRDTVFLTGDIHTSWAFEVPVDAGTYPLSRTVATELVVPSVTSDNIDDLTRTPPRTSSVAVETALMGLNRHLKWAELDSHGYAVLDVRPAEVRMSWYFLADRQRADSPASLAKSVVVPAGTQSIR